MPDKRKGPTAPETRRKRVPPTIDLSATDVTPPPPPAEEPVQATESMRAAAPQPEATAPPPPPPPEEPLPRREDEPPMSGPPPETPRRSFGPLAAGLVGGVAAAVVLGAVWYATSPRAVGNDSSAQIADLQKQIRDLQNRPAPRAPAADTKAVDALAERVAKMEDAVSKLPKGDDSLAPRLAAAENAMKALGVALAALNQRSDDASSNAARAREQAEAAEKAVSQLRGSVQEAAKDASSALTAAQAEALQQRLAALEQASKSVRAEIGKTADGEKVTRLALSAAALRNAVISGAPFNAELAQAKSLGADEKRLAPLAPFAVSGVPSAQALAQDLRAQIPAMMKATGGPAAQGGFLDRLQANAGKLVRVTPVDAPPGDDPSAVLARIEVAAARSDIASALADLNRLPEAARAPAQGWMQKARARQAALDAANSLAADAARALASR